MTRQKINRRIVVHKNMLLTIFQLMPFFLKCFRKLLFFYPKSFACSYFLSLAYIHTRTHWQWKIIVKFHKKFRKKSSDKNILSFSKASIVCVPHSLHALSVRLLSGVSMCLYVYIFSICMHMCPCINIVVCLCACGLQASNSEPKEFCHKWWAAQIDLRQNETKFGDRSNRKLEAMSLSHMFAAFDETDANRYDRNMGDIVSSTVLACLSFSLHSILPQLKINSAHRLWQNSFGSLSWTWL